MLKSVHHICIETDRYEESLEFFRVILGFEIVKEIKGFHGRAYNTWLKNEGIEIELQTTKGDALERMAPAGCPGIAHVCFSVDDLKGHVKEMLAKGYNRFREKAGEIIYVVEGKALCKVIAPEGTVIELREAWSEDYARSID